MSLGVIVMALVTGLPCSSTITRGAQLRDQDELFAALQQSPFRRRFRLGEKDRVYYETRGIDAILSHGRDFIRDRLSPAAPKNDGKQTPMRGHPVFVAQHGTATCCRRCLWKWHFIPVGKQLSSAETDYVIAVLRAWLLRDTGGSF